MNYIYEIIRYKYLTKQYDLSISIRRNDNFAYNIFKKLREFREAIIVIF